VLTQILACRLLGRPELLPLESYDTANPFVFLHGHDHALDSASSRNLYGPSLDCIEHRAEALSGSGNGHRLHIHLIDKKRLDFAQRTAEGGCPHMVRI
jgi:hypothetical protein